MIARHDTFINEPLTKHITMSHLFCPNEPPFKQTHEPQRKTKERNMCIPVKTRERGEKRKKDKSSCNMWGCSGGGWH